MTKYDAVACMRVYNHRNKLGFLIISRISTNKIKQTQNFEAKGQEEIDNNGHCNHKIRNNIYSYHACMFDIQHNDIVSALL